MVSFSPLMCEEMNTEFGMDANPPRNEEFGFVDSQGRDRFFSVISHDGQGTIMEITPLEGETILQTIGREMWFDPDVDASDRNGYLFVIDKMMEEDLEDPEEDEEAQWTDSEEDPEEED